VVVAEEEQIVGTDGLVVGVVEQELHYKAANGTAGTANTGGGGGGGSHTGVFHNGGAGGSGIVIIRYKFQN
jgi:hypothetical protein